MKMWAGRFRQPLDSEFANWQRSFSFDWRLLAHELAASRVHARALKESGILSSEELAKILQGLEQIASRAENSPGFRDDDEAEDVHHFVEKQLVNLIGDTGYKLHSGRSRNEQIATDLRLYVRDSIDKIQLLLANWLDVTLSRADKAGGAHACIHASAACRTGPGCSLAVSVRRNVFARLRQIGRAHV